MRVCDLTRSTVCPGGELEKRTKVNSKDGKVVKRNCKYCWNCVEPRVRRTSVYQCSLCKVSLCVTCNFKFHNWLKFSDE